MIAAIANTGTLWFRVFDERFTGPVFLDFLTRLTTDNQGGKIHLILDGHPAHRARVVRDWVAAHPDLIELHFLPGYSPELNPAECLNQDVKTNALGKRRPLDVGELKADVTVEPVFGQIDTVQAARRLLLRASSPSRSSASTSSTSATRCFTSTCAFQREHTCRSAASAAATCSLS